MLNVTPATITRWIKSGLLVAYRAGGRGDYRFKVSDVERLMVPFVPDK